MADVLLVHFIYAEKRAGERLFEALTDIRDYQRLECGYGWDGHGCYAFFVGEVPPENARIPAVVFAIAEERVGRIIRFDQAIALVCAWRRSDFVNSTLDPATAPQASVVTYRDGSA